MNQKIKARWLKALRSGRYKQAKGRLRVEREPGEYGFCCLGVLCDLARKSKIREWDGEFFDGIDDVPPKSVWNWAGLMEPNPVVMTRKGPETLSALNDRGVKFSTIANYIEKSL